MRVGCRKGATSRSGKVAPFAWTRTLRLKRLDHREGELVAYQIN